MNDHEYIGSWIRLKSGDRWHRIKSAESTYCGIKAPRRFERARDLSDVPKAFVCKRCAKTVDQ